jgi:hypothetical protein
MTTALAVLTVGAISRELTAEDALWLARALTGEAGNDVVDAHACASVIVRRWAQKSVLRGSTLGFTPYLRAFSQPINPRWMRGGDLSRGSTEAQLQRRDELSGLAWARCTSAARSAVESVLRGNLAMRGAVDWGAPSLYTPHGLDTSSVSARLATAPRAVERREGARGRPSPRYEHDSRAGARANVFSSDAESRSAPEPVVAGQGGQGGGLYAALAAVVALGVT